MCAQVHTAQCTALTQAYRCKSQRTHPDCIHHHSHRSLLPKPCSARSFKLLVQRSANLTTTKACQRVQESTSFGALESPSTTRLSPQLQQPSTTLHRVTATCMLPPSTTHAGPRVLLKPTLLKSCYTLLESRLLVYFFSLNFRNYFIPLDQALSAAAYISK